MKKNILYIVMILCFLLVFVHLQYGRKPTLNNSTINQTDDTYNLSINVTLNKLFLINKKAVKKQLIQYIENNTFPGVLFSYDVLGKPQTVTCTVYTNSWTYKSGAPAFQFQYIPLNSH